MPSRPPGVPPAVERLARTMALPVQSTIRLDSAGRAALERAEIGPLRTLRVGETGEDDLRVIETLGSGGMGQVRLARQLALDRDVALKSILPTADQESAAGLLLREAVITGRLEHPNIVPVHLLGLDEQGSPILVMKRVEGRPWSELDADDRSSSLAGAPEVEPLLRHLEIFLDVCLAVSFAHARGYVHRDIKPNNVMIGAFGEVYLLDWGISTPIGTPAYAHARGDDPAMPLGTPAFMAPEMIAPDGVIDVRTDVFLLGATLHRVLTGKPRHAGDDVLEVLSAAARAQPYAYETGPSAMPAELATICNRATAAAPEDRHASAKDLREAVLLYLRHRGSFELTREAEEILETIEASEPGDELARTDRHRRFTECRFAFMRALREWGDNERARRGLRRCLVAMVRRDIALGALDSARALVDELDAPPDSLVQELAAARAAAQQDRVQIAAMRQVAFESDVRVGWLERAALIAILGVLVVFTAWSTTLEGGPFPLTPAGALRVLVPFYVAFGAGFLLWRRRLLGNEASRRLVTLTAIAIAMMTANRAITFLFDGPFEPMLAADLLLIAIAAAAAAVTIDRHMWGAALVWLLAALALPFFVGSMALAVSSSAQLVGLLLVVVAWVRRSRVPPGPPR